MTRDKDDYFRSLMKGAEAQGWRIQRTTKGHWQFCPADKSRPMVVTGNTTGDAHSIRHFLSQLKKSGYKAS